MKVHLALLLALAQTDSGTVPKLTLIIGTGRGTDWSTDIVQGH